MASWHIPIKRIEIIPPDFSTCTNSEISTNVNTVSEYMTFLAKSHSLVEYLVCPELLPVLEEVIAQRHAVVCKPYMEWLEDSIFYRRTSNRRHPKDWTKALQEQVKQLPLSSIVASQRDKEDIAHTWIVASPVHIVLTALASRTECLGHDVEDMKQAWKEEGAIKEWHELAAPFMPTTAVLNFSTLVVGTSCMRWPSWPLLHHWERDVRQRSFSKRQRRQFKRAGKIADAIAYSGTEEVAAVETMTEAIRGANMPMFRRLAGEKWLVVGLKDGFKEKLPCLHCHVMYPDVFVYLDGEWKLKSQIPPPGFRSAQQPTGFRGERLRANAGDVQRHCAEGEMCRPQMVSSARVSSPNTQRTHARVTSRMDAIRHRL